MPNVYRRDQKRQKKVYPFFRTTLESVRASQVTDVTRTPAAAPANPFALYIVATSLSLNENSFSVTWPADYFTSTPNVVATYAGGFDLEKPISTISVESVSTTGATFRTTTDTEGDIHIHAIAPVVYDTEVVTVVTSLLSPNILRWTYPSIRRSPLIPNEVPQVSSDGSDPYADSDDYQAGSVAEVSGEEQIVTFADTMNDIPAVVLTATGATEHTFFSIYDITTTGFTFRANSRIQGSVMWQAWTYAAP